MENDDFMSEECRLKLELMKTSLAKSIHSKTKSKKEAGKEASASAVKKASKKSSKKFENKKTSEKSTKDKENKYNKSNKTKTKQKKESQADEPQSEIELTTRKWDDNKGKRLLKGPFTAEEEKKVLDAFCEYAWQKELDQDQLLNIITEKQTKKDSSLWTKVSECLANRSVQSIHNFCHRKFNPYNYKGNWSDEEVGKLLKLHAEHGNKWELIGKELERTATNVKDKFKQIGGNNFKSRVKDFTLALCLKLLKYIENWLSDDHNQNEYKILKYSYKFRKDVDQKFDCSFYINDKDSKMLIDNSIKETPSRVIIRNIIKKIVDPDVLEKIVDDKLEISWSTVSQNFVLYSTTDCKNNFEKILREFDLVEKSQMRKDLKMIKQLLKCEYDSFEEINFSLVKNKRTADENKLKLEEIVRLNDIYSVKSLNEILSKAQGDLEARLHVTKNEDREFEEELKKNKPFDIVKIFNEYLEKKRGR